MVKNKRPFTVRPKKILEFPIIVLETKEYLRKTRNQYFSIMQNLTENPYLEDDLKRMWISLERAEKKDHPGLPGSADKIKAA